MFISQCIFLVFKIVSHETCDRDQRVRDVKFFCALQELNSRPLAHAQVPYDLTYAADLTLHVMPSFCSNP